MQMNFWVFFYFISILWFLALEKDQSYRKIEWFQGFYPIVLCMYFQEAMKEDIIPRTIAAKSP